MIWRLEIWMFSLILCPSHTHSLSLHLRNTRRLNGLRRALVSSVCVCMCVCVCVFKKQRERERMYLNQVCVENMRVGVGERERERERTGKNLLVFDSQLR